MLFEKPAVSVKVLFLLWNCLSPAPFKMPVKTPFTYGGLSEMDCPLITDSVLNHDE